MCVDRRLLDHRHIVEQAHIGHAATGVTRIEIGAQQRKLFAGRFRGHFATDQIGVAASDPFLVARRHEVSGDYPNRYAGGAPVAGGAIGNHLAAAETGMGECFIERLREVAIEPREYFSLGAAGKVRARAARREEKLRYARCPLIRHGIPMRLLENRYDYETQIRASPNNAVRETLRHVASSVGCGCEAIGHHGFRHTRISRRARMFSNRRRGGNGRKCRPPPHGYHRQFLCVGVARSAAGAVVRRSSIRSISHVHDRPGLHDQRSRYMPSPCFGATGASWRAFVGGYSASNDRAGPSRAGRCVGRSGMHPGGISPGRRSCHPGGPGAAIPRNSPRVNRWFFSAGRYRAVGEEAESQT